MSDWQLSVSPQKKRRNEDEDSLASTVVGNSVIQRPPKPPDPPDPFSIIITASHTSPISALVHVIHCNNILSQSVMTEELENLGPEDVKIRFGGRRSRHVHPKDPTSVRSQGIRTPKNTTTPNPGNVAYIQVLQGTRCQAMLWGCLNPTCLRETSRTLVLLLWPRPSSPTHYHPASPQAHP